MRYALLAQGPADGRRRLCRRLLPHRAQRVATPDVQVHFIIFSTDRIGAASCTRSRASSPRSASFAPRAAASCASSRPIRRQPPAIQPRYLSSRDRPRHRGGRAEAACARSCGSRRCGVNRSPSIVPGPQVHERRRAARIRARGRHDRVPPELHLPHGHRRPRRGRRAAARARRREPARRRRLDHADAWSPATPTPRSS